MTHSAFPHLKKAGNGVILNISSMLQFGATWYQSHPSAAKAAIDSLTRSYGLEWGEYGIRVVGIAPGPVANTAGMSKLSGGANEDALAKAIVPLGRLSTTWVKPLSFLWEGPPVSLRPAHRLPPSCFVNFVVLGNWPGCRVPGQLGWNVDHRHGAGY